MENQQHYIRTEDGVSIALTHYEHGHKRVIVLAHGFFNNKDTYFFKAISKALIEKYDVVAFDFRGHGRSKGFFSWTAKESLDVRAAVTFACSRKYRKVAVMGFSLGAASTAVEAAQSKDISSVILVSCPYDFNKINFRFWQPDMLEDLKLNFGPKGKGKRALIGNPFSRKIAPIQIIDRLNEKPVLFLHGEKDWIIDLKHSQKLFNKAREPKELYIFPNAGHAERIFISFPDRFKDVCFSWLEKTLMD